MAWGYWSATSVSDRGRSPRREKDKQQHQSLHQQQAQQQMHQSELSAQSTYSSVQQERELAAPGVGVAVEEPPCSMMIQGGSFYSYSAATAAAAAAAANRRIITVEGGGGPSSLTSTGIQVLPRERHVKPGTSAYPPSSPGSGDSAEYEQPLAGHLRAADLSPPLSRRGSPPSLHHHHHHPDDIFAQPIASSSRMTRLLQCPDEGMDELSEAELDEVVNAEMIYGRIGPTATCRLHGPCIQQPLPPLPPDSPPSLLEIEPVGPSQFQFNEITWGRCEAGGASSAPRALTTGSLRSRRLSHHIPFLMRRIVM